LLKSIYDLHDELKNFHPETIDRQDRLKAIRDKISNLASEIDNVLRDVDGQVDNSCDEHLFSDTIVPTESNSAINQNDSPMPSSPKALVSDVTTSSSSDVDIDSNIMKKFHRFELAQNIMHFSKCSLCDNAIIPYRTYHKCTECDYILDQNCHHKKKVVWSILPCKPIPKQKFQLNSNVIVLLKKCFGQIEQRGIEHRRLYFMNNNNSQEACKLLDKYLSPNNSAIAISKLNMNTICAMVINMLKRLDDSLIPSDQWNDFAKLSVVIMINCDLYTPPSPELVDRIAARRRMISTQGKNARGVSPNVDPETPPPWFEKSSFEHAQKLFKTYRVIQLIGLNLVLNFTHGLVPLLVTGNSKTISKLFVRYLSTTIHVTNWFEHDPFDKKSKAYRSLRMVRGMHQNVASKMNTEAGLVEDGETVLWIPQYGMCHAQFSFVGMMTVFPKQVCPDVKS
ncbi:hypothetical protein BLA29_002147, partial [Euroglyphus maynei]